MPDGRGTASLARRLCLLVLPLLAAAAALRVSAARGPEWLGTNHDPTYTYLLSALAIAEGAPPGHVDHPGTPVQAAGALVLRLAHQLVGGATGLAEDVLAQPEMYLGLLAGLQAGLYCALLWISGRVLLRITGSLGAALAVQAAPLASVLVALELPTFKPEPLLLSIGAALAALVACTLDGRRPGAPLVAAMGALAGVGIAAKVTAAPLLALPLVLAAGFGQRAVGLAAAAGAFAAATAPAWSRAGDFLAFQRRVATQRGMYGVPALAHLLPYRAALRAVAAQEWLVLALGGAALVVLATSRKDGDARHRAARRALLAITLAVIAEVALVAVHPYHARYLVPVLGLLGLAVALLLQLTPPGRARAVAAATLVVAGALELRALSKHVFVLAEVAKLQRAPDGLLADYPQCPVVTYDRASSLPEALRHADGWLGGRYSRRLAALHPGAVAIHAHVGPEGPAPPHFARFAAEVPTAVLARHPCLLLRGASGGPGQPFSTNGLGPDALPLEGRLTLLSDSTLESLWLLTRDATGPVAPFDGWSATAGLDAAEGPYPRRGIVRPVRWGLGRATRLGLPGEAARARLVLEATSYLSGQSIVVSLGSRALARVPIPGDGTFVRREVELEASAGETEVTLRYERSLRVEGRELAVLFSRLSLEWRQPR
jgi:hypothetical protein